MKNQIKKPEEKILKKMEKAVDKFFACIPRKRPEKQTIQQARLIAHRGAHDRRLGIEENTSAAFKRALELGCWGIEFDVHACADEVIVINHDPDLVRIWNKNLKIRNIHFKTLQANCPDVPSLNDIVREFGKKLHLFVEIKSPFTAFEALQATLKPLEPCTDYHIISLDKNALPNLTMFPKESLLLVPVHDNVSEYCKLSLYKGYGGVLGHYLLLRDKYIKALEAANQIAGVGFIDSKNSLLRELNRGVKYLFSNKVEDVSKHLHNL